MYVYMILATAGIDDEREKFMCPFPPRRRRFFSPLFFHHSTNNTRPCNKKTLLDLLRRRRRSSSWIGGSHLIRVFFRGEKKKISLFKFFFSLRPMKKKIRVKTKN